MDQIYEYILAIAEEGSFKNAAQKLHVTQPALSCDVTRSVSKMTEIEGRGGKRWDKPKKAEKSRDCGGGKF